MLPGSRCDESDMRACEEHWEMVEGKYVMCSISQKNGAAVRERVLVPPFRAPWKVGENSFESPPESLSRGNAIDRATLNYVNKLCNNEHALAHQQFIEMHDVHTGKQNLRDINPSLCELSGLDVHIPTNDNGIGSADAKRSGSGHRTEGAGDVDAWRKPQLTIQNPKNWIS